MFNRFNVTKKKALSSDKLKSRFKTIKSLGKKSSEIIELKLKKTLDESTQLKKIYIHKLTPDHNIVTLNNKLNYTFDKSEQISDGSYNLVYKVSNNINNIDYALRISLDPMDSHGIANAYDEARLSLRLSVLGITPKIHDSYFAYLNDGIRLFVLSDLSNQGDLLQYLKKERSYAILKHIGNQTVQLYTTMVENEILCTDIKEKNMVIHENPNKSVRIKVIDFDTYFCSAEESKIKFNDILKNKCMSGVKDRSIKRLKKLFLNYNLLQLSLEYMSKDMNHLYYKTLVDNIDPDSLIDIANLLTCEVGEGQLISKMFIYYFPRTMVKKFPYLNEDILSMLNVTYICAKYGMKNHSYNIKDWYTHKDNIKDWYSKKEKDYGFASALRIGIM